MISGQHPRPALSPLRDLCRQVHIITCCGEPQYCTLCSGKREIAEKESHWPHFLLHLTLQEPMYHHQALHCYQVKELFRKSVDLSFILGFRDDCILWLIWKWVLSHCCQNSPNTFSFLWQPRMDIFSNGACELAFTNYIVFNVRLLQNPRAWRLQNLCSAFMSWRMINIMADTIRVCICGASTILNMLQTFFL